MGAQVPQAGIPDRGPGPTAADSSGYIFPAKAAEESQSEERADKRISYGVDVVLTGIGGLRLQPHPILFGRLRLRLHQLLPPEHDPLYGALPGPLKLVDSHAQIVGCAVLHELLKLPLLA